MDARTTIRSTMAQIAEIRRDRALLREQIKTSQETIERSRALLKRIDDLLANIEEKPHEPSCE